MAVVVHTLCVPRWSPAVARIVDQLSASLHCLTIGDWESCAALWDAMKSGKLRLKLVTILGLAEPETEYLSERVYQPLWRVKLDITTDSQSNCCLGCASRLLQHWPQFDSLELQSDCLVKLKLGLTTLPAVVLRAISFFCEYAWSTHEGKTDWARSSGNIGLVRDRVDLTCCKTCRKSRDLPAPTSA